MTDPSNQIAGDAACVVALDLSQDGRLRGALVGTGGSILQRAEHSLAGATGRSAATEVANFAANLVAQAGGSATAISVGTPGIVDSHGVVQYATALQWRDVRLAELLANRFGLPALVGNDIDVTTLGVVQFRVPEVRDLLLVSLDNSIGMGIVVGGHLVVGENYNAGEIAHVTVFEDGATCICGRRGCIVAYVSAARTAVGSRFISVESKESALVMAGRALGAMVAPIASALNLTTVVVSGPGNLVTEGLLAAAAQVCESRTLPLLNTRIEFTALRDDADLVLIGAAAQAFRAAPAVDHAPKG